MNKAPNKIKVIVGMSGGVDSSVSALLLQQAGFHVEGLFMKNWDDDDSDAYCHATEDAADARTICDKLKIPLHIKNFAKEYWDNVFEYFLAEYQQGRTPNPDIICNQEIKFKAFLNYALTIDADFIATGHYATIVKTTNQPVSLHKARDQNKDQSYFLYRLNQHQLKHALFPLAQYEKPKVRKIAQEAGFINHNKKDSTGICFIGERKFNQFLSQYLAAKPGPILNAEGKYLGKHNGLIYYTIGQRKGIGIGGQTEGSGEAWFVAKKNLSNNTLIVVQGQHHDLLYKKELQCQQVNWISETAPIFPLKCMAKTRYRQDDQACLIMPCEEDNSSLLVHFDTPQRAITAGQSIVFYQHDICLGGGIIS